LHFIIASVASLVVVATYLFVYSWQKRAWIQWVGDRKSRIKTIADLNKDKDQKDFSHGYAQRESSLMVSGTIFAVVAFSLIAAAALTQSSSTGRLVLAIAASWYFFEI
jgi:hypothetical protein